MLVLCILAWSFCFFKKYPCHFCPLLCPVLHEAFLGISNFLEVISSIPFLLLPSVSLHCSLMNVFLFLLTILWNSAFSWVYLSLSPLPFTSLLSSVICEPSSDNYFAFMCFFFFGMFWSLPPVQCHEPLSIVLQALCLSDLILWIYFSLHCIIIKDLI